VDDTQRQKVIEEFVHRMVSEHGILVLDEIKDTINSSMISAMHEDLFDREVRLKNHH